MYEVFDYLIDFDRYNLYWRFLFTRLSAAGLNAWIIFYLESCPCLDCKAPDMAANVVLPNQFSTNVRSKLKQRGATFRTNKCSQILCCINEKARKTNTMPTQSRNKHHNKKWIEHLIEKTFQHRHLRHFTTSAFPILSFAPSCHSCR